MDGMIDETTDTAEAEDGNDQAKGHAAIIEEAVKRRRYVLEHDSHNFKEQREDIAFTYKPGAQWGESDVASRTADNAPVLEFNQLPQFVNQVVNDQRQRRPGIRVHPAGGRSTEELAKMRQGVIRGIEAESRAEAIYDSGFRDAVVGGRGYWRVVSEYVDGRSFDQVLRLKMISDPLTVKFDPDYSEPDGSDAMWCFVDERVTKEEFSRRWPKAKPINFDTDRDADWFDGDHVIVSDYLRRTVKVRAIVRMSDGAVGYEDEMPKPPAGVTVVARREKTEYRVEWYKLAGGQQIVETYEWPGDLLPVVMCMGDNLMIDGKRVYQGLIRRARDAQRMYNYAQSAVAERVALAPKAPYVMAEGQDDGYEDMWRDANKRRFSRLIYKPKTVDGQLAPPPQRQQPIQAEQALLALAEQCKQDLRATIGMYENSLGLHGQETSGRAILAREQQGDNATFHFPDNLGRAIGLTGRIVNGVIKFYYDTQRQLASIADDGTKSLVTVNQPIPGVIAGSAGELQNSLLDGEYTVVVESGPSYATKRIEAADSLMQFVQAFPPAAQVAGDLIAKMMDWPDADVLARRMKFLLPPAIQQSERAEEGEQEPQVPPEIMAQLQQMQQALQQMQQQSQALAVENADLKAGHDAKFRAQQQADAAKITAVCVEAATKLVLESLKPAPEAPMAAPEDGGMGAEVEAPEAEERPTLDAQMQIVAALTEQVRAMGEQMAAAVLAASAPRQVTLQTDAAGNPIGAVSVPAMVQ